MDAHRARREKKRKAEAWSEQKEKKDARVLKREKRGKRREWLRKVRSGEATIKSDTPDGNGNQDVEIPDTRDDDVEADEQMDTEYREFKQENKRLKDSSGRAVPSAVTGSFEDL